MRDDPTPFWGGSGVFVWVVWWVSLGGWVGGWVGCLVLTERQNDPLPCRQAKVWLGPLLPQWMP